MEISKVEAMSPLTWAYVGDSIYEAYIRTYLVETTNLKPHKLHVNAIKYVKAKAQAEILKRIHDSLTEKEQETHKTIMLQKMQTQQTICMQQHLKD